MYNTNFYDKMDKNEKTLKNLRAFRLLLECNIHSEEEFRMHLLKRKKVPDHLRDLVADSVNYQRFLETMLQVFNEVIDDITL